MWMRQTLVEQKKKKRKIIQNISDKSDMLYHS